MSLLTKLFVVLLVICSFLLTAGMVVFINRTEDYRLLADTRQAIAERLAREKQDAVNDRETYKNREIAAVTEKNNAVAAKQTEIKGLDQKLADSQNRVAELSATVAVNQATITEQATALKAIQQTLADAQTRNNTLVADNDKVRGLNYDLTGANTDFQKRLDEAERERRWLVQTNTQIKNDLTRDRNLLAEHRIPLDSEKAAVATVLPDLKGVIRKVEMKDGLTYATISLGFADHVEKGMEFKVVNMDTSEFLGIIKVDAVNQNEAYGKIEGPRVQQVKPDCQVLSHL